jgi:hypothetical protein
MNGLHEIMWAPRLPGGRTQRERRLGVRVFRGGLREEGRERIHCGGAGFSGVFVSSSLWGAEEVERSGLGGGQPSWGVW